MLSKTGFYLFRTSITVEPCNIKKNVLHVRKSRDWLLDCVDGLKFRFFAYLNASNIYFILLCLVVYICLYNKMTSTLILYLKHICDIILCLLLFLTNVCKLLVRRSYSVCIILFLQSYGLY